MRAPSTGHGASGIEPTLDLNSMVFRLCTECRTFHWNDEPCAKGIAPALVQAILQSYRGKQRAFREFFVCWCGKPAAANTAQCERHGFPPRR